MPNIGRCRMLVGSLGKKVLLQRPETLPSVLLRSFATSSVQPLTYYSAWFCPFAHRTTIALEHHADVVPYAWEEALGWEKRPPTGQEEFSADERKDWYYHWKSPGLLKANPLGMIPTLVEPSTARTVTESIVAIQFVDEVATARNGAAPPLLPSDLFDRAHARVAADKINKVVCSSYYACLVREEAGERKAAFEKLKGGLLEFAEESKGDFHSGGSLGLADCVLLPYAYRLYVLEHYRGPDFALPASGEGGLWERYHAWLARCVALPAVARTLPDQDRYLVHVRKYAEGKARSKVGNAVRRGASAHEYDDKVDG